MQMNNSFVPSNPYLAALNNQMMQRYNNMEQSMMTNPMLNPQYYGPANNQMQNNMILKGRAVTSIDEAKASMIDLDGSLFIFPDLNNNKIYTKQVDLNGKAILNVYGLEAPVESQNVQNNNSNIIMNDKIIKALEVKIEALNNEVQDLKGKVEQYESNANVSNVDANKPGREPYANNATDVR